MHQDADEHMRLLKATLTATFPAIDGKPLPDDVKVIYRPFKSRIVAMSPCASVTWSNVLSVPHWGEAPNDTPPGLTKAAMDGERLGRLPWMPGA